MRSRSALLLGLLALSITTGCDKSEKPAPDQGAKPKGAPPPPEASAKPGACKDGGGQIGDGAAAALFPRASGGYCINPEGQVGLFGDKAPKPIDGICAIFDGGCEAYLKRQAKRVVNVDYVDGGGGQGTVTATLSQFATPEHAFSMFALRVTNDEDPTRADMPKKVDAGSAAAMGTGTLYAWKGAHLLELSYVNTEESGNEPALKASAEKVLPQLGKAIAEKLPAGAQPPGLAELPTGNLIPLGQTYVLANALGAEGTGPAAIGHYKQGDKRYRVLAIAKADADQAKDVLKSFSKKKGATEEKGVGEGAYRLMVQDGDGPKAEWVVARKGAVLLGIGDETFALKAGESAAEHDKVCLSRDDKIKELKAALDRKKLSFSSAAPL